MTPTLYNRLKDVVVKAFWTMVAVAAPALVDTVQETDVPAGLYVVFAAVANVVLALIRQYAGKYVPPPAEDARTQLPETRL